MAQPCLGGLAIGGRHIVRSNIPPRFTALGSFASPRMIRLPSQGLLWRQRGELRKGSSAFTQVLIISTSTTDRLMRRWLPTRLSFFTATF